jgi:hypothetical protein
LLGDPFTQPAQSVDFVEKAGLARDDFGQWSIIYSYAAEGPAWRLSDRAASLRR